MSLRFTDIGIDKIYQDAIEKEGITIPTEVQAQVIPAALENRDVIARSETGTGKTLAYLLPLVQKLKADAREVQAMVLVPTHELAIQVLRQLERLSENSGIKVTGAPIIGDVNIRRQIDKLKEKPHVLIGSPGRMLELIKMKRLPAHTVKTIVLDEGDRLLEGHNIDNVKAIIKSTLRERQLMMFSASITPEAVQKAEELMKSPLVVKTAETASLPDTLQHCYFTADARDKLEVLRKVIRIMNPEKAIVFINKPEETQVTAAKLKHHGFELDGLHGASYKLERKKALEDFRSGRIQLLIASDIAARGLDLEGITHIFNLDIPESGKDYLHRSGRTGRQGREGMVVSIVAERELPNLRKFEREFKIRILHKAMRMGAIVEAGENNP